MSPLPNNTSSHLRTLASQVSSKFCIFFVFFHNYTAYEEADALFPSGYAHERMGGHLAKDTMPTLMNKMVLLPAINILMYDLITRTYPKPVKCLVGTRLTFYIPMNNVVLTRAFL